MTSFFTTGGIRGGKKKMDKFYPRSYNMGIRSEVYRKLGGFAKMRFRRRHRFQLSHCGKRLQSVSHTRGLGMAQTAHGFQKVLQTGS